MYRRLLLAGGLSVFALTVLVWGVLLPRQNAPRAHAASAPRPPAHAPRTLAPFTDVTTQTIPGLPQLYFSSVAWGDYDNDGKLDFILSGSPQACCGPAVSKLYHNTGTAFEDASGSVQGGLPPVYSSSVAWGDYDNDGKLDFLLTGCPDSACGSGLSKLYHNSGTGFVDASGSVQGGLPQIFLGSVAWGDYDNDGELDFLIAGSPVFGGNSPVTRLYHNTGTGFVDASSIVQGNLPQVTASAVAWGDYDNDGKLDFLLTGCVIPSCANSVSISRLYHNTGSGFEDASGSIQGGLPLVFLGSVAWGDYDNDGRLDFLLTGMNNLGVTVTKLFHNTGTGFDDASGSVQGGLPGVYNSSVAWGDYDNDGRLDFLISGCSDYSCNSPVSRLYHNTGTGFEDATPAGLPQEAYGGVAWGDFDNDGKLDFLFTGCPDFACTGAVSRLYHNDGSLANTPPTAPGNLQVSGVTTRSVTLRWDPASDAQTPPGGLNYNLRVGSSPGASDIVGPMANPGGLRRLPALGPARPPSWPLTGLAPGTTYYWSVQALDTAFAGGPFAPESSFTTLPGLTATPSPTGTPGPSSTPAPTDTPGPSPTLNPSNTAGPSPSPVRSATPFPSNTPSLSPTPDPTATPGASPTPPPTQPPSASPTRVPPSATPGAPSATPAPTTATPTPCALAFADVQPGDYFYGPVQYLYCHGVVSGYADGTFRPYADTTRSQMVKIVVLGAGLPLATPTPAAYTFADVPPGSPFFAVVETAATQAVVSGYGCGGPGEPCDAQRRPYFRPYADVTRGQLAKITVGAAGWPLRSPAGATFADVAPGSTFYPFVETAVCHGVISGYADGTFRPGANATRGQISKIVDLALTNPPGTCSAPAPR